jgi:hypothetical protein
LAQCRHGPAEMQRAIFQELPTRDAVGKLQILSQSHLQAVLHFLRNVSNVFMNGTHSQKLAHLQKFDLVRT